MKKLLLLTTLLVAGAAYAGTPVSDTAPRSISDRDIKGFVLEPASVKEQNAAGDCWTVDPANPEIAIPCESEVKVIPAPSKK
jgi:hypothetical protein